MLHPPVRVVIVPDKFKGTLTAKQAASAIARGWKRARPEDELDQVPMSDGGDGFGPILGALFGATPRRVATVDAVHRTCRARWWWKEETRTAIIETAEVIGLAALSRQHRHPPTLDTAGLANVLRAASNLRPRRCLIGLGGSATNDGGFGLARGLGWQFLNRQGGEITGWPQLISCRQIIPPARRLRLGRMIIALDVQNPLLGVNGCTRIYGPQKGLHPSDSGRAERALKKLAEIMARQTRTSAHTIAGAGAAGGLGFGLMTFLGAKPVTGFSLFAREAGLARRIRAADCVITGEGCLDPQSLMGKGVGELLRLCQRNRVPCIAIGGRVELSLPLQRRFTAVYPLTSGSRLQNPPFRPGFFLSQAAARAARQLGAGRPSHRSGAPDTS